MGCSQEELMSTFVPIVLYWAYSGLHELTGGLDKYRLHPSKDEETKNLVSKREVVKAVLLMHAIQAAYSLTLFWLADGHYAVNNENTPPAVIAAQFLVAVFVFAAWQYFVHRCMHQNKFLYRNFHSRHHRLLVPYACGSQYVHPVDGILNESVAGSLGFWVSGMSARTSIYFFTFEVIKGMDDHTGLMLPWDPFQFLFGSNPSHHEVHHQLAGIKFNFAQPLFAIYDKLLGTHVPYTIERRDGGGFEARMAKPASH